MKSKTIILIKEKRDTARRFLEKTFRNSFWKPRYLSVWCKLAFMSLISPLSRPQTQIRYRSLVVDHFFPTGAKRSVTRKISHKKTLLELDDSSWVAHMSSYFLLLFHLLLSVGVPWIRRVCVCLKKRHKRKKSQLPTDIYWLDSSFYVVPPISIVFLCPKFKLVSLWLHETQYPCSN